MICDISSLEGRGLSLFKASDVSVQDSTVSDAPLGGIAVYDGSRLTLDSVDVLNNGDTGVLASGDGSTATVQDSAVKGNQGYGLNAQNGATISCSGSTEVSDNAQGPTLGNVEGCN
jgi:hypothetical protein